MCAPLAIPALAAGAGYLGAGAAGIGTLGSVAIGGLAASSAAGAVGSYQQAQNAKAMANYNAGVAEIQAQDALMRGDEEAARVRRQSQQMVGAQRTAFSAKGLDLGAGSVADELDKTDFFGEVDRATTRDNAKREAWSRRAQRNQFQFEAATRRPAQEAALSLMGSAGQVADRWYSYKGK